MTTSNNITKKIIFTGGLPGSGKSTVIGKSEFADLDVVDCDKFKKLHPQYDPKNPSLVHEWSTTEARKFHLELLSKEESFIVDGTGTNVEKYLRWFNEAREMGFEVVLVYVKVKMETSIKRNAIRERSVPVELITEKAEIIDDCMNILGSIADDFKVIEND